MVLGVDRPDAKLNLNFHDVLGTGRNLTGAIFGGLKAKRDISTLVKWYLEEVMLSFI